MFAQAHSIDAEGASGREAALGRWCANRDDFDAVELLQGLGVAAGVVQDMQDLFERDPTLRERQSLMPLEHPLLGTFGHMRTPIDFSLSRPRAFRAPSMGEHNRQIAATLCGLPAARIDELEKLGVFK